VHRNCRRDRSSSSAAASGGWSALGLLASAATPTSSVLLRRTRARSSPSGTNVRSAQLTRRVRFGEAERDERAIAKAEQACGRLIQQAANVVDADGILFAAARPSRRRIPFQVSLTSRTERGDGARGDLMRLRDRGDRERPRRRLAAFVSAGHRRVQRNSLRGCWELADALLGTPCGERRPVLRWAGPRYTFAAQFPAVWLAAQLVINMRPAEAGRRGALPSLET